MLKLQYVSNVSNSLKIWYTNTQMEYVYANKIQGFLYENVCNLILNKKELTSKNVKPF